MVIILATFFTVISITPTVVMGEDAATGLTIMGRISSEEGPVENITVIVDSLEPSGYVELSETVTDKTGGYLFTNLTKDNYVLGIEYNGIQHLKTVSLENETVEANFNLIASVSFSIVNTDGSPLSDIDVGIINRLGFRITSTVTDEAGVGHFEGMDFSESYMIAFNHEGIPYTNVFSFENGTSTFVDFRLLSATTSDEDMEGYMHHVIVEVGEENINVWEAITFRNTGTHIFNNSMLSIWLPDDAVDLTHEIMDCCVQLTEEGLMFDPMEPIRPTESFETSISYNIKIKKAEQVVEKRLAYDTETFFIFVKKTQGVTAEALEGISYDGDRTLGGEEYIIFKGTGIPQGGVVSLKLTGLMTLTDTLFQSPLLWAALFLIAPVGFVVYLLRGKRGPEEPSRKHVEETAPPEGEEEVSDEGAEQLMDLKAEKIAVEALISRIEGDYESGEISASTFERLIRRYEERLQRVKAELKDLEEG